MTAAAQDPGLEQRRAAVRTATRIRVERARVKADLKAGEVSIDHLLVHPPPELLTMKLGKLLVAIPRYGPIKAQRVLTQARVAAGQPIGAMTLEQRREVLRVIRVHDLTTDEARAARNQRQRDTAALRARRRPTLVHQSHNAGRDSREFPAAA